MVFVFNINRNLKKLYGLLFILFSSFSYAQLGAKPNHSLKKDIYDIGIFQNPPLSFINDQGNPDGFFVEILEEIAKKEKFKINWVFDSWQNILTKVKSHDVDMISSVVYSREREILLDFSTNNFAMAWLQIYLSYDSKIKTFVDLDKQKIALIKGSTHIATLLARCKEFEISCSIIELDNYESLFKQLNQGLVNVAVATNNAGIWYAEQYDFVASSIIFNPIKGFVATPKGKEQWLLSTYDSYLLKWKKDAKSVYNTSRTKWFTPKHNLEHSRTLWNTIIGLSVFGFFALLTAVVFKRKTTKRTQEIFIRNEQFSQIINLVPHIIYVSDESGNILLANKKAAQYFGMTQDEIKQCSIENYKNHHYGEKLFLNDDSLNQSIGESELVEVSTKDFRDNQYTLLLSKMPFTGLRKDYRRNVTVAVDITEIKEYEKKIIYLAHYNQVTGLPNKTLFKIRLEESINRYEINKKVGALLFFDVDGLKKINGLHGYNVGDILIKNLVKRFNKNLHGYRTLAHLGGGEFVIDISELDKDIMIAEILAVQFAELVQAMISKPMIIEKMLFEVTACIGIAVYPRDGKAEEKLMQRLGTALNEAKNKGNNNLKLFDEALERKEKLNHSLESELRLALDKNQFVVYYQPIFSTQTSNFIGAEALIRWSHPTKGLIAPGEFIDVAEKIRLIVRIGDWVLEQACKKIKENIIAGRKDFFIAVNVSVLQIKNKYFLQRVSSLIAKYNIPANYIELEITESVLMEDIDLSVYLFGKLKQLGVKISIDDFGTGYSSFSYLMKLPIDKIKIDQSFVKVLPEDDSSATIVRTIIKMAHELDMKVVAEGVETQEQYDFLIDEGCQFFQGYYLHRPMEYSEIIKKGLI